MRHRLFVFLVLFLLIATPAIVRAQDATPTSPPVATSPVEGSAACQVGRQEDGSVVLPTNQVITPAGQQIEFLGRPVDVALRPDGKTAAFLTNSNPEPITVVDLATNQVVQLFDPGSEPGQAQSSFAGILYSPDGTKLYASDYTGLLIVATVAADGTLTLDGSVELDGGEEVSRAGGMALSDDGATLYVALNLKNSVAVVDLATKQVTGQIAVGNAPYGVVVAGDKAYVSNQGGRPAENGEYTNNSGGADIVADPTTGGTSTGTVSVVDLTTNQQVSTIDVGLQPTAMLLRGTELFVANTNADTISLINTETDRVDKTIAIQVFPGAPFGSSPNGLAMVDDDKLVVSLGRNNALAVFEWEGADQAVKFEGLVPTGWYPASIAVDAAAERLIVANAKGVGSLGPETEGGPEATNPTGKWVHSNQGSVSVIPFADLTEEALPGHTASVYANNQWSTSNCSDLERGVAATGDAAAPVPVPLRIGDPSTIKHVFYIIKVD